MIKIIVTPPLGEQIKSNLTDDAERMKRAVKDAAQTASEQILERGRADISGAGRFGTRWTEGLTADVDDTDSGATITVRQEVPYWRVFEYGAVIQGKPLLWIPLSFAGIEPGTSASQFPGALFRVDRKSGGAPLLLSVTDKQPKYSGHESVTIPQKFHIVDICVDVAGQVGALYRRSMNG